MNHSQSWAEEYIRYMLDDDPENGLTLKAFNFPKTFFRYRTLNDYTINTLEKNELYFAKIKELNDPFECAMVLDHLTCLKMVFSSSQFRNEFEKKNNILLSDFEIKTIVNSNTPFETYRKICMQKGIVVSQTSEEHQQLVMVRWQEIIKESSQNVRVCCFSEVNDSTTMWSHYADNHRGICVEYDFTEDDNIRPFIQPIFYSNEMPIVKKLENLTMLKVLMGALHKSPDWSYEREWRITSMLRENGLVLDKMPAPTPKAIYLGHRFQENNHDMISKLETVLNSKHIPVYQVTTDTTSYRLLVK